MTAQEHKDQLLGMFDWLVPVALRFVRRELKEATPTLDANLVVTLMKTITSLTDHMVVSIQLELIVNHSAHLRHCVQRCLVVLLLSSTHVISMKSSCI